MTSTLKQYFQEFQLSEILSVDLTHLRGDLVGGLTSAIVALPLALGFGILAYNGDPRGAIAGLYGAIFTGILASVFGGTRRQITGPTGGMTVILTSVYVRYGGADALLGACLIAGILQIGYAVVKAGKFISFIPYPVIVGFTNGIAILIFIEQLHLIIAAPVLGAVVLIAIVVAPIIHKGIPRSLSGLIVGTVVAVTLYPKVEGLRLAFDPQSWKVFAANILPVIGEIPHSLSVPHFPSADWTTWTRLFPAGLTISLLGALETLLASVVADSVTGDRHNSNRELLGQGIANSIASLFGGIAGTGAIVRTNVNIRAGGVTRLSGVIHGVVLLGIVLALAPMVASVPLSVLAAVLMMTAIGMFEWEPLRLIPKTPAPDAVVMIATMVITVFSDLITAVLVGFALAGFLFVYRMSELGVTNLLEEKHMKRFTPEEEALMKKHRIIAYDIEGPLFFGAARNFVKEIEREYNYRVIILNMESVPIIDTTGALAIEDIVDRVNRDKKFILIAGLRKDVRTVLHRLGVTQKVGIGHFSPGMPEAIRSALNIVTGAKQGLRLGKFISPDLIMLDIKADSKEELFTKMTERAYRKGFITNKATFLNDLWAREESESTGIERGIAIPHSRSGSAGNMVIVVARIQKPVEYETLDGSTVKLVFLIAASEDNEAYLKVLALLARAIRKGDLRERLLAAKDEHEVYDLLAHEFDQES